MNTFASRERIALWDNVKFVLITLVVIGHVVDFATSKSLLCKSIFLYIYAFHMPLFIFISGLFFRHKNIFNKALFFVVVGFLLKILHSLNPLMWGGRQRHLGCFLMLGYLGLCLLWLRFT